MNSRARFLIFLCALFAMGDIQGDSPFDALKRRSLYESDEQTQEVGESPLDRFASFGAGSDEDSGTVGHALFEQFAANEPDIEEEEDTSTALELGQKLAAAITQLAEAPAIEEGPALEEPPAPVAEKSESADAKAMADMPAPEPVDIQPSPFAKASEDMEVVDEPVAEIEEKEEELENDKIYLNFENAELKNVIAYMANLRKINLIPDKGVEGSKISLTIRRPLSPDEAWRIFHTVLDRSGFSIVKVGLVYKVVTKDKKNREPLQAFINVSLDVLPDSDETIRYVSFLENVKVSDVIGILKNMLDSGAMVLEQADLNAVIIADKSYNIKAAMKVINELDKTGLQETVVVMRLRHADAKDVRDLFKSLVEEKQPTNPLARLLGRQAEGTASYFAPGTKLIAEERTNSLVLLGPKDSVDKIETFIKEHVDTELKATKSPLHVYELQYADAKQIVALLKEATATPESASGQEAVKYGAVRGGVKYFKPMTFHADIDGNRIIVSSMDVRDWKLLKETIRNLDKPQPQVAIETLIVLADSTEDKQLGGVIRNKSEGQLGDRLNFQSPPLPTSKTQFKTGTTDGGDEVNTSLLGNLLNGLSGGLGTTLLTFGRESNIWGIFQSLQTMTHATVLAQPFLTITNKYKSTIKIGEIKRVLAQTTTTGIQGFTDNEVNALLQVKPQINIDGVINLEVEVHLDEFTDPEGKNRTKRKLKTSVSVADGQVLVLGGLVRNKVTETTSGTPILKDIPGVGWFFKNKTKSIEKRNVLIFLSPTIIKPRTTQGINPYTRMKLDIAKDAADAATKTGKGRDPIHDWFFDPQRRGYSYKVDDFATARYQPVTVDIKNDTYYRTQTKKQALELQQKDRELFKEYEEELPADLATAQEPQDKKALFSGLLRGATG